MSRSLEERKEALQSGFRIGDWSVEPGGNRLQRNGQSHQVGSKAMDLLVLLASHAGETVSKEDIFSSVWSDTFVTDNALWKCVSELRHVLEEDPEDSQLIVTVPRRGYRIDQRVEARAVRTEQAEFVPMRWSTGAGLLALLATGLLLGWAFLRPYPSSSLADFERRPNILITRLDNRTGEAMLGGTLEVVLEGRLNDSGQLQLVSQPRLEDALALMRLPLDSEISEELAREVSQRDQSIDLLVTGQIDRLGSLYRLSLKLLDGESHELVASAARTTPSLEGLLSSSEELAAWLLSELKMIEPGTQKPSERVTTNSLQALSLYVRGLDRYGRGGARDPLETREKRVARKAEAATFFKEATRMDPEFASAHLMLAWSLLQADTADPSRVEPDQLHSRVRGGGMDLVISRRTWAAIEQAMAVRTRASLTEQAFIQASYFGWKEDPLKALSFYRLVVELQPEHHWASNNLMWIGRMQNDPDIYLEGLLAQHRARPNDLDRLMTLTTSVSLLDDGARALEFAERADVNLAARLIDEAALQDPMIRISSAWLGNFQVWSLWRQGDYAGAQIALGLLAEKTNGLKERGIDVRSHAYGLAALHVMLGQLSAAEALNQRYGLQADDYFESSPAAIRAVLFEDPRALGQPQPDSWRLPGLRPVATLYFDTRFASTYQLRDSSKLNRFLKTLVPHLLEADPERRITGLRNWLRAVPVSWIRSDSPLFVRWILARELLQSNHTTEGIQMLEALVASRDRTGPSGVVVWQKAALELAEIYHEQQRFDEAARMVADLEAMLQFADPDHPILRKLGSFSVLASVGD